MNSINLNNRNIENIKVATQNQSNAAQIFQRNNTNYSNAFGNRPTPTQMLKTTQEPNKNIDNSYMNNAVGPQTNYEKRAQLISQFSQNIPTQQSSIQQSSIQNQKSSDQIKNRDFSSYMNNMKSFNSNGQKIDQGNIKMVNPVNQQQNSSDNNTLS